METFEFIVFILVLASCTWLGLTAIWQRKEISELKERVSNEKKPIYNVWLSALSNKLPYFFDNPHISGTKGKKCPWDFEDITKKMSFKLSDLKPTEKDVALAFQKQQFEEKEKMYVEKIRQLEKILADEEIKISGYGQVTNMKSDKLKYEKYELNLEKSHLQNEVERLSSLLGITEKRYVALLDFVIYKHKNGITTVDIDFKKTRDKIEKLIEESNKKSK